MVSMFQDGLEKATALMAAAAAGLFVALNGQFAVAIAGKAADAGAALAGSPSGAALLLGSCAAMALALRAIPRS
jgi:hypothetical protein